MNKINVMKYAMNDEDQILVGNKVIEGEKLNVFQISAIWQSIDSLNLPTKLLEPESLNFVVDDLGNEGIIPGTYNEYLKDYSISNAYFYDLRPLISEIRFQEDGKTCIIYIICEQTNDHSLYLNRDAFNVLSNKTPEEISNIVKKAQSEKKIIRLKIKLPRE